MFDQKSSICYHLYSLYTFFYIYLILWKQTLLLRSTVTLKKLSKSQFLQYVNTAQIRDSKIMKILLNVEFCLSLMCIFCQKNLLFFDKNILTNDNDCGMIKTYKKAKKENKNVEDPKESIDGNIDRADSYFYVGPDISRRRNARTIRDAYKRTRHPRKPKRHNERGKNRNPYSCVLPHCRGSRRRLPSLPITYKSIEGARFHRAKHSVHSRRFVVRDTRRHHLRASRNLVPDIFYSRLCRVFLGALPARCKERH